MHGCVGATCAVPDGGSPPADAGVPPAGDCRLIGCPAQASHCRNPWTLATSTSTGTCDTSTGHCSFNFAEKRCEQPPGSSCSGTSAVSWFESPGSCVELGGAAACVYASRVSPCSAGCSLGKCTGVSCAVDAHACGNVCVTNSDVNHCGKVNCGSCPAPAHAHGTCTGACSYACDSGFALCGGDRCEACPVGTAVGGEECSAGGTRCIPRFCDTAAGYWLANGRCYLSDPTTTLTTTNSGFPKLARGPTGNLHLAFVDLVTNSNRRLGYKKWDGTAWSAPIFTPAPAIGLIIGIGVDPQDRPTIVYTTFSLTGSSYTAKVAAWNGTGFTIADLINPLEGIDEISVVSGSDGTVHVAWDTVTTKSLLHYGTYKLGQFTPELIGTEISYPGSTPSIQLDPLGNPVVGYRDGASQGWAISRKVNGVWTRESAMAAASLWGDPHLELGPTGEPYLVGDGSFGDQVMLSRANGQWTQRALPSLGGTLTWAIDPQGLFVGLVSASNSTSILSTKDGAPDGMLVSSQLPTPFTGSYFQLLADPKGGYWVVYVSSPTIRLFHFR